MKKIVNPHISFYIRSDKFVCTKITLLEKAIDPKCFGVSIPKSAAFRVESSTIAYKPGKGVKEQRQNAHYSKT